MQRLGPGLVAAASNNDPTTVATLAVVGATTGYLLCWLVVAIIPMLALVQRLAADVGAVARTSLQGAIRREYGRAWAVVVLIAVAAVNVVTLGADVKAGSEALALLVHAPAPAFVLPFVAAIAALLLGRSYTSIERGLSVVPLAFLCYAASAVLAHADAGAVVRAVIHPAFSFAPVAVFGAIALIGTTMTAYVYLWESIGVSERPADRRSIRFFERDAIAGMVAVGIIFLFILVASAATLGHGHAIAIATAADMAAALTPLAGPWAGTLFGIGLLASAVLAVPVVASTCAYAAAHTFDWPAGLDCAPRVAPAFYTVLTATLAAAAIIAFIPVPAVTLLFWASIFGGLATPLTLIFLVAIAANRRVMGEHVMNGAMTIAAWAVVTAVTAAGAIFLVVALRGA